MATKYLSAMATFSVGRAGHDVDGSSYLFAFHKQNAKFRKSRLSPLAGETEPIAANPRRFLSLR